MPFSDASMPISTQAIKITTQPTMNETKELEKRIIQLENDFAAKRIDEEVFFRHRSILINKINCIEQRSSKRQDNKKPDYSRVCYYGY